MKYNLITKRFYGTGVKLLLGFVIVIIIFSVYQTQQVITTGKKINNAEALLVYSKKINALALDNESAFRAYILTGKKTLLTPFQKQQNEIQQNFKQLQNLTGRFSSQKANFDSLVSIVNTRINFANSVVADYEKNGMDVSMKIAETSDGKLYTERVGKIIASIQEAANMALVKYKKANEKGIKNLQQVLLVITGAILLLLAVFIRKIREDNDEKVKTAAKLKALNDDLEQRVKERTKELTQKEQLFRALVENNEGLILLLDENMQVFYSSDSTETVTGWKLNDNEKISGREYLHPDDVQNALQIMAEAVASPGNIFPIKVRVKHKEGHYIWLEGVVKNMLSSEAVQGIIVNLRDTTYNVEEEIRISKAILDAQEQERSNIGAELHDNVNQLLASSLLALSMVNKKEPHTKDWTEFLEMGKSHILTAVDELRRLSHNLVPASFEENTLKEALENLLKSFNLNNRFTINFNFDMVCNQQNADLQINLYRILQEQIKNIARYSEADRIDISVKQEKGVIKMRIYDNGRGFNVKTVKKGIGLNNIKRRTESFSGKFVLNSAEGKGCELLFELPLSKAS
ncbi:MAG: CHASE3 domain-containing protein [Ferruginibacter sp.]|nr:CHASE3 domain-containing protein [Ferruginibacter sp.]